MKANFTKELSMNAINDISKPYVIFSCIGPVENARVHTSLKNFSKYCVPIVITSRKFSQIWASEKIQVFQTKYNSVARYKVISRSIFLRSRFLSLGWVKLTQNKALKRFSYFWMQPHTARHFEALRLLSTLNKDEWAYLVGSRDVVFQISPSIISAKLIQSSELHFFDEGGLYFKDGLEQITKNSRANLAWASQLVNGDKEIVSQIYNEVIINADCIFGRIRDLEKFLQESCSLLSKSEHSSYALLDQASTNIVGYRFIRSGMAQLHKNGEVVLNMCGVIEESVQLENGILMLDTKPIPIVHQFDRYGSWHVESGLDFHKREYKVQ